MDIIEKLIKALEEAKEELSKTVNQSYSGTPNMAKDDFVRPDKGYGKVIIKDPTPKPKDPANPYGKVVVKKAEQPEEESRKKKRGWMEWEASDMGKEELKCSANGQWNLLEKDSANPALAPKDRKVKQLQAQIDAGTYKPDASKIAGAMLSSPEKPLKKEEPHADDPKHEEKEEKKAAAIKATAQELLDMHKK